MSRIISAGEVDASLARLFDDATAPGACPAGICCEVVRGSQAMGYSRVRQRRVRRTLERCTPWWTARGLDVTPTGDTSAAPADSERPSSGAPAEMSNCAS